MTLLGLGGPKAFVTIVGPNNSENGPIIEYRYVLVGHDNTVLPGPIDTWFTEYVPFSYNDNVLSIELRIQTHILFQQGDLNINVVFII